MSSYSYQRSERNLLTVVAAVAAAVISIGMSSYTNAEPFSSIDTSPVGYHATGSDAWIQQLPLSTN